MMSHTKWRWVGHYFTYVKEVVLKILNNSRVYTYNAVRYNAFYPRGPWQPRNNGVVIYFALVKPL